MNNRMIQIQNVNPFIDSNYNHEVYLNCPTRLTHSLRIILKIMSMHEIQYREVRAYLLSVYVNELY